MHLNCRKYRIHNHLQAKKNEDLFRRTSDDDSKTKNNMTKCSDIIDAEPSSHQEEREDQFKKNDVKEVYTLDGHIEY